MDKREWYYQEAQRLRRIMSEYHNEAIANHTAVPYDFHVKDKELAKLARNYRAYCKRHSLPYSNHDI